MAKVIVVKVAGAPEPREITVHPGTTAGEVLRGLGLSGDMLLTKDPAGVPFGADEVIYDAVEDGSKLFAAPAMEVGE